jgi:hypothetical protein
VAATLALATAILFSPVGQAWQYFRQPDMVEHLKPVLAYIEQSRQPGDVIYVYYGVQHAFIYYAEEFGFEEGDYIVGLASSRQPGLYLQQLDELRGKRTWFIFSHNCYWCPVDEQAYIVSHLDSVGHRLAEAQAPKATGYLYELR